MPQELAGGWSCGLPCLVEDPLSSLLTAPREPPPAHSPCRQPMPGDGRAPQGPGKDGWMDRWMDGWMEGC